jgi:hypothetical protein
MLVKSIVRAGLGAGIIFFCRFGDPSLCGRRTSAGNYLRYRAKHWGSWWGKH